MKDGKKITASREESTSYMNQTLPMRESFDLIQRDLMIGERMASFYFINGLNKDDDMLKLMDALLKIKKEDMPAGILQFMEMAIPYTEVELIEDIDQVLKNLFSVSEAPALIIKVQYLALMRQPVQQSCCEDSVAKKLRPAIKAFI